MGLTKASQLPNPDIVADGLADATLPLSDTDILAVFQNGAWKKVAKSEVGGGGGSSYLVASVTLTDAQIKALPSTRIKIIDAPGANKMVVIMNAFAYFTNFVTAYTANNATMTFVSEDASYISGTAKSEAMLEFNGQGFIGIPAVDLLDVGFNNVMGSFNYLVSSVNNSAIYVKDDFYGASNYTGGNSANTLKVTVYYVVVDL